MLLPLIKFISGIVPLFITTKFMVSAMGLSVELR